MILALISSTNIPVSILLVSKCPQPPPRLAYKGGIVNRQSNKIQGEAREP